MPSKSLTLKFGADTSKLDRAMKRLRASFAGVFSARGLIGGAIAGIGLKGLVGAAMNVNEKVANAMLKLEDHFAGAFASAVYRLEPTILRLIDAIIPLTEALLKGFFGFADFYKQIRQTFEVIGSAIASIFGRSGQINGPNVNMGQFDLLFRLFRGETNLGIARYTQQQMERLPRFVPPAPANIGGQVRRGTYGRIEDGRMVVYPIGWDQ